MPSGSSGFTFSLVCAAGKILIFPLVNLWLLRVWMPLNKVFPTSSCAPMVSPPVAQSTLTLVTLDTIVGKLTRVDTFMSTVWIPFGCSSVGTADPLAVLDVSFTFPTAPLASLPASSVQLLVAARRFAANSYSVLHSTISPKRAITTLQGSDIS